MTADATSELPNLGLLIKLLKMTTSSNDAEALIAMRRANEQLIKFGGDWENLLRGKVTVIGDPFAGTGPTIDEAAIRRSTNGQKPPSPGTPPPPRPAPQPPPHTYSTPRRPQAQPAAKP